MKIQPLITALLFKAWGGENMTDTWRLLLLEDDSFVAEILKLLLTKEGFACDVVENEDAAVKRYLLARTAGSTYSAIILDLVLGNDSLGGLRVLRRIKESDPAAKAILCSGFTQSPVVMNYQEYGFDKCLRKPFSGIDLVSAISGLLNHEEEG